MIKGYSKLHENEKDLFKRVYNHHLASMGIEQKKLHSIENIKEVKANYEERCIEVHYKHEWYKYHPDLTWS